MLGGDYKWCYYNVTSKNDFKPLYLSTSHKKRTFSPKCHLQSPPHRTWLWPLWLIACNLLRKLKTPEDRKHVSRNSQSFVLFERNFRFLSSDTKLRLSIAELFSSSLITHGNSLFIGDVLICLKRLLLSNDGYTIQSSGLSTYFDCLWNVWSGVTRCDIQCEGHRLSVRRKKHVNNAFIEFDCLCADWCLPEDANERGTSNNFIINRRNWKENYCVVKLMQLCWLYDRVPDWNVLFHLWTRKPCKVTANELYSKSLEVECTAPLILLSKVIHFIIAFKQPWPTVT